MTMPVPALTGRGAWSPRGNLRGKSYYLQGCSTTNYLASQDKWAVFKGVLAIQILLKDNGVNLDYSSGPGIFGPRTHAAVLAWQKVNVPPADGLVGRNTMKSLLHRPVGRVESIHAIPNHYLWGLVGHESAYDPGAIGYSTPYDIGLVQINMKWATATEGSVMHPLWSLNWGASNMRKAYDKFRSWGVESDRAWSAAILNHNAPSWATTYAQSGVFPNEKSATYVASVKKIAATY